MNQTELQNNRGGGDALDSENYEVAALLSALPRVEAPENFEFRVRAGIAKGSAPRASLIPFLKVAAPLSLVLTVGAFGIFYGTMPSGNEAPTISQTLPSGGQAVQPETPVSAASAVTAPAPQITNSTVVEPSERAAREEPSVGPVRRNNHTVTASRSRRVAADRPFEGGSKDQALGSANTILPKGFETANPQRQNLNANVGGTKVPVGDVLGMLGVNGEFTGGGWKVRSVAANTSALRAGVKPGDLIEAIDGTPVAQGMMFSGGFSVKTIRIRRDGKTLSLNLGN